MTVPLHKNSGRKNRLQEFLAFFVLFIGSSHFSSAEFYLDVLDFGAVGDGHTNDTQAFLDAWDEACGSLGNPIMVIPKYMTFLVHPLVFSGPCRSTSITVAVIGTVIAPDSPAAWKGKDPGKWLEFIDVSGLTVAGLGFGALNGRGLAWWNQSCRDHPRLQGCTSVAPTGVNIFGAPELSPNTDGIHIHSSHDVFITNSVFSTGDDCISIGDYTSNVVITNVICGPGHGISIGSLGRGGNSVQVENIHVSRSYLKGTTNGLRIKTWQVGRGYVRNVLFQDITFDSVQNPIIIDQNYCSEKGLCKEMPTGVHITNVTYTKMVGSSSTAVAINFDCDRSVPCTGLNLRYIYLWPVPTDLDGTSKITPAVTTSCANAHGYAVQVDPPVSCLQS
ncbi:PREDICTED: probable polygalacturonase At3g15720 isoform X2 [Tarenaya hassleriana]|uniref:probable polygalacturonase At3g15720 isoform X2 n=1 Tax=Tarenaya hassleriana TaxID=28532 RepID=UPI00053C9A00|nr:PREDICTED: probable polygalacturonase At3g15720 isoform X2 [Tarenaya hassleriana]